MKHEDLSVELHLHQVFFFFSYGCLAFTFPPCSGRSSVHAGEHILLFVLDILCLELDLHKSAQCCFFVTKFVFLVMHQI